MLFIGDDWAQNHHDIEIEDETGHRLARARVPEGLEGITRLHTLLETMREGLADLERRGLAVIDD